MKIYSIFVVLVFVHYFTKIIFYICLNTARIHAFAYYIKSRVVKLTLRQNAALETYLIFLPKTKKERNVYKKQPYRISNTIYMHT